MYGTKNDKLVLYDVDQHDMCQIPTYPFQNKQEEPVVSVPGIRAMALNPSGQLLATCSTNTNDITIYAVPSLVPVAIGSRAHSDLIFDLTWVSDGRLAAVSRDGKLSLWSFEDVLSERNLESFLSRPHFDLCNIINHDEYDYTKSTYTDSALSCNYHVPLVNIQTNYKKLRALTYDKSTNTLIIISTDGHVLFLDCATSKFIRNVTITGHEDNTCITFNEDLKLGAIGSRGGVHMLDPRLKHLRVMVSRLFFFLIKIFFFMQYIHIIILTLFKK